MAALLLVDGAEAFEIISMTGGRHIFSAMKPTQKPSIMKVIVNNGRIWN